MTNKSYGLTLFVIVLVFTFSALNAQTRTVVTLGGSFWNANYSLEDQDGNKLGDFGSGSMYGPYLSISQGKLNLGTSLFFGKIPVEEFSGDPDINSDMSRNDINFTLGYRVHRNINLFIGGKYINWKIETDYTDPDFGDTYSDDFDEKGMMYGLGISAVIPFGTSGWYLFGSLAGMAGTLQYTESYTDSFFGTETTDEIDVDSALAALNLGIGVRFPSGFGINVGYRADLFSEEYQNSSSVQGSIEPRIRVEGLIATISYSL